MTKAARAIHLSKRTIDAAEPEAARYTIWDDDLKGFGLRVEPSGAKTFIVRYRFGGGRRGTPRQFKIGRYGKLTPDKAREAAVKIFAAVELGQDPQALRVAQRNVLTVSELCDLYLQEGVATKKASTLKLDRIRIERHIKPLLGGKRITDLTTSDVDRFMQDIAAGKVRTEDAPHTRGGRGAASRTIGLLSGIFAFALRGDLCPTNPAKGVKRFPDVQRDRFLSPKELGELGRAFAEALDAGASAAHVAILQLLLFTGARKNEIARLKWSEVDLGNGRLNLEDSKTGRGWVSIPAPALEILAAQKMAESEYVFPNPKDSKEPVRNLDWAWVNIRNRAGLDDLRIHDLRHTFASAGVGSGKGLYLVGKLLRHAHPSTTSRYAHLADDPLWAASDEIAQHLRGALESRNAEVRPFPGKSLA